MIFRQFIILKVEFLQFLVQIWVMNTGSRHFAARTFRQACLHRDVSLGSGMFVFKHRASQCLGIFGVDSRYKQRPADATFAPSI